MSTQQQTDPSGYRMSGRKGRQGWPDKTIYRDWSIVKLQGRERDRHTPPPPKTQRSCPAVCCAVFSLIRLPSSAQTHPVIRTFISPGLVNPLLGENVIWKFCQVYYLVHHSVKERALTLSHAVWSPDVSQKRRCQDVWERGTKTELAIKMSWVKSL